ncbi:FRG domain-containing protein [Rhizobium leguminosarum]|uniref:FRG domain-containing protein n=1 Tax=Rhizobium leguminosarum TaxID=384 RepID=UPI0021501BAB|nr:FRG domain-containing protein [Rhizobium leguminosarum]
MNEDVEPSTDWEWLALVHATAPRPLLDWSESPCVSLFRAGSVCLNSSGRFAKWISASIMLPPSSASAH